MKIYFAGSIRGGRLDQESYLKIIKHLQKYGEVLTEHIGKKSLLDSGERDISEEEIYQRDLSWLKEADVFIAEVSTPSLGIGYEIARAENLGKDILCFYNLENKNISAMIRGNKNISLKGYNNLEQLYSYIDAYFKEKEK